MLESQRGEAANVGLAVRRISFCLASPATVGEN